MTDKPAEKQMGNVKPDNADFIKTGLLDKVIEKLKCARKQPPLEVFTHIDNLIGNIYPDFCAFLNDTPVNIIEHSKWVAIVGLLKSLRKYFYREVKEGEELGMLAGIEYEFLEMIDDLKIVGEHSECTPVGDE